MMINFRINSATPSNPANRTPESIYHTFHFVFSVRPEVNFDVHPCGLDRFLSIHVLRNSHSD